MKNFANVAITILLCIWQTHIASAEEERAPTEVSVDKLKFETQIALPNLVEGRKVSVALKILNHTDYDLTELVVRSSSSLLKATLSEKLFAREGALNLSVTIEPPRGKFAAQITLQGVVDVEGDKQLVDIASIGLHARCNPPLRPTVSFLNLRNGDKLEGQFGIIASDKATQITDLTQVKLGSDLLDVLDVAPTDFGYTVKVGLKEGKTAPDGVFAALLSAPFSYSGSDVMQMEEVMHFTTNPRIEVVPNTVRLKKRPANENDQIWNLGGDIIFRDFTGTEPEIDSMRIAYFAASLVARDDNRVLMVDPNAAGVAKQTETPHVVRMKIQATYFYGVVPEDSLYLLVRHNRDQVDASLSWDDFAKKYAVFPVVIDANRRANIGSGGTLK